MTAIGIKNVHCACSALATVFRSKITQPLSKEIVIFYTEILTGKVVLWCFFLSETSEKIHNSIFQVKIERNFFK